MKEELKTLKECGNANESMTIYDVREWGRECYKEYMKRFEDEGTLFWKYGACAINKIFDLGEED